MAVDPCKKLKDAGFKVIGKKLVFDQTPKRQILGTPAGPVIPAKATKAPWHKGKPVGANQVIDALAGIVDVPIRIGRFRQQALGIFKVADEIARIRTANDIPVAAHETFHAIEKAVFGSGKGMGNVGLFVKDVKGAREELFKMGVDLYGSKKPAAGYVREGFAEYGKFYVSNPDVLAKKAPKFHDWFTNTWLTQNPEIETALNRARDLAKQFRDQGPLARVRAAIKTKPTLKERVQPAKKILGLKAWIDEFRPLELLSREANARMDKPLAAAEDPFVTASALRYTHTARTRYMVNDAMIDLAGNPVGPSLEEAAAIAKKQPMRTKGAGVKNVKEEFTLYLLARRAIERWDKGQNPGISLDDANEIFNTLDSDRFQLAAAKVYEWNRGVLNYASQAGLIPQDKLKQILAGSEDYIPLQRVFENAEIGRQGGGGGPLGQGKIVYRFKGSGRRIRDPFQAMIENAERTVRLAHERVIASQILRLRDSAEGLGFKIEQVPRDLVPQRIELARIEKQLKDAGVDLTDVELETVITYFTPAQYPKGKDPIVPLVEGGKIKWFEVDAELYGTLQGLDIYRMPKILDWIFGKPTRAFRLGTTGLRPAFSLVTNWMRDLPTFMLQSAASNNPTRLGSLWLRQNFDIIRRLPGGTRNKYHDLFVRLGGEMSQPLGQDTQKTRALASEIFQGRTVRTIAHPIEHLRDFLQIPESATRTAELRALAENMSWTPGQPLTFDQSVQLLFNSKRVTTDFSAAGNYAKVANQAIPFFNASTQGTRTFMRTFRRSPVAAAVKATSMLTLPTLAYWWVNKDKEWYKDMPWREKFTYWYFEVDDDTVIRIPRPFEWGNFFSVMPEAILDAAYTGNPDEIKEAFSFIADNTFPDLLGNPLVNVSIEQLQNRSRFFKSPIVPRSEEDLPLEEQVGPYTTRVAEFLGNQLKLSPRRIDHAIRGIGGGAAGDITDLFGKSEESQRDFEFSDLPVVGRLFRRGGTEGTRSQKVEDLFKEYRQAVQIQKSRRTSETDEQRKRRLILNDAVKAISAMATIKSQTKELKDRQRIQREIRKIAEFAIEDSRSRQFFKRERKAAERKSDAIKELRQLERKAKAGGLKSSESAKLKILRNRARAN